MSEMFDKAKETAQNVADQAKEAAQNVADQVKDTVGGLLTEARPAHERRVKPLPLLGGDA